VTTTARYVAHHFLRGALDVFDALLSKTFTPEILELTHVAIEDYEDMLAERPVVWRGEIASGRGGVVLLMSPEATLRLNNMVAGVSDSDKATLEAEDYSLLREVAESSLGGGVTAVLERCDLPPEALTDAYVGEDGAAAAGTLTELLSAEATRADFRVHDGEEFSFEATLLFSTTIEQLVPEARLSELDQPQSAQPEAALSDAELQDILSGVDAGAPMLSPETAPAPAGGEGGGVSATPDNLDMILDLRLMATARLGNVEMPINDILNLGPGSIIEVGHLVDEPIELLVNGKLIARGDVVVVDEKFGLRITEIVSTRERIESLR